MKPSDYIIPGKLKYVTGDATIPITGNNNFIIHVQNDVGAWGAGFSGAVGKRWPAAENAYRLWYRQKNNFKLGEIQVVNVQSNISVINMIAQKGLRSVDNPKPIDYDALRTCLDKVGELVSDDKGSIHAPRFGAGLAGGDWEVIEEMIQELLIKRGINVTIYDLPE